MLRKISATIDDDHSVDLVVLIVFEWDNEFDVSRDLMYQSYPHYQYCTDCIEDLSFDGLARQAVAED